MPYAKTYGFPPYDPSLPGGGWDAETWMLYRQQQRGRAYPGQFPSKTERLERNARRSAYKRADAIAKIDATLARNELGERPPDIPATGNPDLAGRRSGAQVLYDRKVERRARLQAQRDRLAALGGQAASTPTTIGTPQATTPATGANAYVDPATGIPIAKAAAASGAGPAQVARAKQPIAFSGPQPPTVKTLTTAEQAAIDGMVGSLGSAYATPGARKKRPGDGEPTVIVTGTPAVPAYSTAPAVRTRSAGTGEPTVIVTTKAPKTTKKTAANAYAITNTGKSAPAKYTAAQRAQDEAALKTIKNKPKPTPAAKAKTDYAARKAVK